jgi:CHAT domain-containing protein
VPDLVVSSYTPTVRALARTRTPRRADNTPATLIVPVPHIPGAELPGVTAETNAITTLIPDTHILHQPTHDRVLTALPAHRIAHFSCHGYADWTDPAQSRLFLTDHATMPLTLTDITTLKLDADLAYLSACETAVTAPRLADESLHITGAFHLAGYRHVIGTLWPVDDPTAAQIAEDFYTYLTADGTPDPDRAAHALHHATRLLRTRYPATPTLWAAHTHTGGLSSQELPSDTLAEGICRSSFEHVQNTCYAALSKGGAALEGLL